MSDSPATHAGDTKIGVFDGRNDTADDILILFKDIDGNIKRKGRKGTKEFTEVRMIILK